MRSTAVVLFLVLLAPQLVTAQGQSRDFDLGPGVSGYTRFLLYPHLQKGWELLDRGDTARAVTEFERARELAPDNTAVALYLADALRRAGNRSRAEAVLRAQLQSRPGEARVRAALDALTIRTAAPAAQTSPALTVATAPAASPAPEATRPASPAARTASTGRAPKAPSVAAVATPADEVGEHLRAEFTMALAQRRFDDALHAGKALIDRDPKSIVLVDEVSYQLSQAGGVAAATRLLLSSYPFAYGSVTEQVKLLDRLALLLPEQPEPDRAATLARLREPLGSVQLRSRQGALWTELGDCQAVRAVLGDMSEEYGYEDLMRLGRCEEEVSARRAQQAYAQAHRLLPGGAASLELGYQAHKAGDYQTALGAWRSVLPSRMSNEHRLAAAMTAVATRDSELADQWLSDYREAGGALDYRYWSLRADSRESAGDVPAVIESLEQATALGPNAPDYLRLARLSRDPKRQVGYLERAVAADASRTDAHLELAYAYQRESRLLDAERALESAAALAPANMQVQLALGYAYWQNGKVANAEGPLLRVSEADPGNLPAARQLVYVSQRLARNQQARRFAEVVLDSLPPTDDQTTAGREQADRRFGLQRLHEDLGRRITFTVDGWSGTQVGTGSAAAEGGRRFRSYSQAELDVRLGRQTIRNGRTVSAYARLMADGGDSPSAAPTHNPRLGAGLRWKPFSSQVLYLAAEHQRSLDGTPREEVLLRTSASLLNGGRHSDDWHPSGSGWVAFNLYLDAAHYVKDDRTAATADFRTSTHLKLASRQTLEPYAHLQVSGIRVNQIDRDVRVGVGSRWNVWHGRSSYSADHGKLTLGVEFQRALDTYLPDRGGVFFTLGSRW